VIREIMGRLDHQFMNELEPFKTVNPSAENVAKYFYDEVTGIEGFAAGARVTDVICGNGYEPGAIPARGLADWKTGEPMNRSFFIIMIPALLVAGGLHCCSCGTWELRRDTRGSSSRWCFSRHDLLVARRGRRKANSNRV